MNKHQFSSSTTAIRAVGALLATALCACSSSAQDDAPGTRQQNVEGADAEDGLPPRTWTDPKGRIWVRADHPARIATPEEAAEHFASLDDVSEPPDDGTDDPDGIVRKLAEMDVHEVAELYRPVTLRDGYEYKREPDLEWAAALQAGLFDGLSFPEHDPSGRSSNGPSEDALQGQAVFGSDDRAIARNNSTFPNSAQIWLTDATVVQGCSATMVGPSTAVTAAHCLMTDAGAYLSARGWAPAVDSQDGYNFGPIVGGGYEDYGAAFTYDPVLTAVDPYPHATGHLIHGCYAGFIPQAPTGGAVGKDWAILEFDKDWWNPSVCALETQTGFSDKPGNATGYLGIYAHSKSTTENNPMSVRGYPASGCVGGCFWPSIWYDTGEYVSEVHSTYLEYDLDTGGGQSGAGVYLTSPAGERVVTAIHKGSNGDHNWGRRITTDVLATIQSMSEL